MVSVVNSHSNAASKRWHLWDIDLRFTLNSTPGWEQEDLATVVLSLFIWGRFSLSFSGMDHALVREREYLPGVPAIHEQLLRRNVT